MKAASEIAGINPINPMAPEAVWIAVFMFRHHRNVRREMNSLRSTPSRLACKSTIM